MATFSKKNMMKIITSVKITKGATISIRKVERVMGHFNMSIKKLQKLKMS